MVTRIGSDIAAAVAEAWPRILAMVESGEHTATSACADLGLSVDHFFAYKRGNRELQDQWRRAREDSAAALEDQIVATVSNPDIDPAFARVRVDALKWVAARRNPEYQERSRVDVTHKVIDYAAILARAEARLAERARPALDGEDAELVLDAGLTPGAKALMDKDK